MCVSVALPLCSRFLCKRDLCWCQTSKEDAYAQRLLCLGSKARAHVETANVGTIFIIQLRGEGRGGNA